MKITPTPLAGVQLIEPRLFPDARGFFMETFHRPRFLEAGLPGDFVQDNHSYSIQGTLRGLHYQIEHPQGKLVRVVRGEIFDVAVDLRRCSPTFGHWFGATLSDANRLMMLIPQHFAHGFCATSEIAEVVYKCTDVYHPQQERTILWNDPDLNIAWPIPEPLVSEKDACGVRFRVAECF